MKLLFVSLGVSATALLVAACGADSTTPVTADPGADAGAKVCTADLAPPEVKNGACPVTVAHPGLQQPASKHYPVGTSIEYCTNPPSSGPHYPVWTSYAEFTQPVAWPYLVHSEEHGGVLLLYNCDVACPDVVDQLRQVRDRAAADCAGGKKRIVIAPSPTIPTRVAAAAWGVTLSADCVDGPTMDEFVKSAQKRLSDGAPGAPPEDICADGQAFP